MAYDLRSRPGDATAHGGRGSESSMVPGKRSLTAELHAGDAHPAGRPAGASTDGGSPPLFPGPVEWEDIEDEDLQGEV